MFEKAHMNRFAGSCYFTARSYTKAADIFMKMGAWSQAGECMSRCGQNKLHDAARYFEKGGFYLRAIECYEQIEEWELLLHCLNRGQDTLGEAERQSLVKKYVPIALNSIYKQFGMTSKQKE